MYVILKSAGDEHSVYAAKIGNSAGTTREYAEALAHRITLALKNCPRYEARIAELEEEIGAMHALLNLKIP